MINDKINEYLEMTCFEEATLVRESDRYFRFEVNSPFDGECALKFTVKFTNGDFWYSVTARNLMGGHQTHRMSRTADEKTALRNWQMSAFMLGYEV